MKISHFATASLAAAISLTSACSQADDEVYFGGAEYHKLLLSRELENSEELNGLSRNGLSRNGLSRNGLSRNGLALSGVAINGSALEGEVEGLYVSGRDLKGTNMIADYDEGGTVALRIDDIYWNNSAQAYLYLVSAFEGGSWQPLCGRDTSNQPIPAIPLNDKYDPSSGRPIPNNLEFSWTCTNAALGKCVLWGYPIWGERTECKQSGVCKTQSLKDWHQACSRMVRADYCGDGVPHTRNGTPIDVYDSLGIQTRDGTVGTLETEWRTDGGWCIQKTRWFKADSTASWSSDLNYIQSHCPERLAVNNPGDCGNLANSDFYSSKGYDVFTGTRRVIRVDSNSNAGM